MSMRKSIIKFFVHKSIKFIKIVYTPANKKKLSTKRDPEH